MTGFWGKIIMSIPGGLLLITGGNTSPSKVVASPQVTYTSGFNLFMSMFNNLALLIILVAIFSFIMARIEKKRHTIRQIILGVIFGIFVLGCMQVKIPAAEGVLVDQRNAVVILAGWFGGPLTGLVTAIIAAGYRVYLGGSGIAGGTFGIFLSMIAGSVLFKFKKTTTTIPGVFLSALCASVFVLPGFLIYESLQAGWTLLKRMAIPYSSASFIGISVGAFLFIRDENLRRTRIALQNSEKRYRKLFDNLMDIGYQTDTNGYLILISPSVEDIFGYKPQEIIGTKGLLIYKNPSDKDKFLKRIFRTGFVRNYEIEFLKKDGTIVMTSINSRLLYDSNGNFEGIEGIIRDITQLKTTALEKQQLEDNLRQSQKMESLGKLAGGIAHDFNNILTAVLGYAELAQLEINNPDKVKGDLAEIISAGIRAKEIISHILLFTRKSSPHKQAVQLSAILQDAISLLKALIPSTISVRIQLLAHKGIILADATAIYQVVLNLCSNAAQSMEDSEGIIDIILEDTEVTEESLNEKGLLKAGPYLKLSVRDQGSGIKPDLLKKIFDPYFTTKKTGKGTGMGLAVVHGIVKSHGGSILVESEQGKGSTFILYFPQIDEPPDQKTSTFSSLPRGRNEQILLIDDEQALLNVTSKRLEMLGYRVSAFENSNKAFDAFQTNPASFDLLITDQVMPGLTGTQLIREIKVINKKIPTILCSGYASPIKKTQSQKNKPTDFLMKPIQLTELAIMVRKVLDETASGEQQSS